MIGDEGRVGLAVQARARLGFGVVVPIAAAQSQETVDRDFESGWFFAMR